VDPRNDKVSIIESVDIATML